MRKRSIADTASRDAEIFDHAVRIFKQKGYHATSMRDIARAVGLQKGSLYHYISGKEELLFRIFEQGSTALTARLEQIIVSKNSPAEKLHCAIEAHLIELCEQLDIFTVYLSERRALKNSHHAKVRKEGEEHARLLEKIIKQGIASGDFRAVDTKMAAHAILGMCNWLYQWYSPNGRLGPKEIAAVFSDLILKGLKTNRRIGGNNGTALRRHSRTDV